VSLNQKDINNQKTGILLANIGSPDSPSTSGLRKFLTEFLSDPRIVDWPRWLWLPILHGIVLRFRPKKSAQLYKNIWRRGSPLIKIMEEQSDQLEALLKKEGYSNLIINLGMRYGNPSIAQALRDFRNQGVNKILIFPLFPQYSITTTASTYDAVFNEVKSWTWIPEIHLLGSYFNHPSYINSLAKSIIKTWEMQANPSKLLFSFHGVPKRYVDDSDDPYEDQCWQTAQLVAAQLELPSTSWQVSFQSRFGPEEWIKPYTDKTLEKWGYEKLDSVHVICPGFSADCLETLDEINREARDSFKESGGNHFHYIPALNNREDHIETLAQIISQHL
jgi:protoporphyrin/coproporphyrin ferrochelatase